MSTVTYPKIIGIEESTSGAIDGKLVRTSRFVQIGSGTSGTITLPPNSTVVLNDFGGTVDAVVAQMSGGRPTYSSAVDAGSVVISTTFDSSGNYSFSGTPSAYPVALVYRVEQTLLDFDSTASDIVGSPQISGGGSGGISTIEDGVTTTTGFGASEILFTDGSVVLGNSKFTYNPTTNVFQVTDGTDRFLRISAGAKTFAIGDLDGAGPYIESNLSSNELQLVANILEMGGNRYTYPAVQGTAGQVLAIDSVALGVATLEWAAGGGGGSIENGVTTTTSFNPNQVIFSDGTNTIGSDSFTYDATSEQFRVRDSNGTILVANPTSFGALDVDDATGTLSIMADPTSYSVRADIGGAGKGPLIFLDGTTGIVGIGDLDGYVTNAHLYIDYLNSLLFVGRVGASTISSDLDKHNLSLGDNDSEANKTIFEVNDQNQYIRGTIGSRQALNLDRVNELYEIGRLTGGNATHISIDDAARDIDLNSRTVTIRGVTYSFPAADGTSGQVLSTNGSGILSWATGGGGGGISAIGTIDSNGVGANGATISGSNLIMQSAGVAAIGLVNLSTQVFTGLKAFSTGLESTAAAITGTGGAGYLDLFSQASTPAAPSTSFLRLWQQSNRMFFSRNGGIDASLDFNATTADRNYAFPDAAGTVVLDTNTVTLTNKTLTSPTLTAGTASANTGPIKFTAGTSLTTPEAGVVEYNGTNFFITAAGANRGVMEKTRVSTSSAGTLTLSAEISDYVFTGTTSTWTLPAVSGSANTKWFLKNRGSGTVTVSTTAAANEIYTTSAVNTYALTAGSSAILVSDGSFYNLE